jgi:hypothetical protein
MLPRNKRRKKDELGILGTSLEGLEMDHMRSPLNTKKLNNSKVYYII